MSITSIKHVFWFVYSVEFNWVFVVHNVCIFIPYDALIFVLTHSTSVVCLSITFSLSITSLILSSRFWVFSGGWTSIRHIFNKTPHIEIQVSKIQLSKFSLKNWITLKLRARYSPWWNLTSFICWGIKSCLIAGKNWFCNSSKYVRQFK